MTSKQKLVISALEMTLRLNCQMLKEFLVYPGVIKMWKTAKMGSEVCISEEHYVFVCKGTCPLTLPQRACMHFYAMIYNPSLTKPAIMEKLLHIPQQGTVGKLCFSHYYFICGVQTK